MCYRELKVEHGVGVWKSVRSEWKNFKSRVAFRVGK